jgi:large subunit ribosomal protein L4
MESITFLENLERKKKAIGLIHRAYLTQLKNSRKHLASTKTKAEVRGGGKKPWKQKGTGNARAGSNRSPLWAGGGVSFGPKPHLVRKKINKKEKKLAILSAFLLKKNQWLMVDDVEFNNFENQIATSPIKTKDFVKFLKNLNINLTEKILIILPYSNLRIYHATKNIKTISLIKPNCLDIKQLLHSNRIILSKSSEELIYSTYGKNKS